MSFQASSWVIKHSKHKGSALLLMLMIANHTHADGTNAFPSIKTLADECRMSSRQVIRLITMLEESGELIVERSVGRTAHNYSVNMTLNPDKLSPLNPDNLSPLKDPNPDKSNNPTLTNPTLNPDIAMSPQYKERKEERKEKERRGGEDAPASEFGSPQNIPKDTRFFHPALKAIREITKHNPDKITWDSLIQVLGVDFDVGRLEQCFVSWRVRGYKPANFGWITDWYRNGIPERGNETSNKEKIYTGRNGSEESTIDIAKRIGADIR